MLGHRGRGYRSRQHSVSRARRRRVRLGRGGAERRAWTRLEGSVELGQGARPSRSHFAKLPLPFPLLMPSLCLAVAWHGGPKTNPSLLGPAPGRRSEILLYPNRSCALHEAQPGINTSLPQGSRAPLIPVQLCGGVSLRGRAAGGGVSAPVEMVTSDSTIQLLSRLLRLHLQQGLPSQSLPFWSPGRLFRERHVKVLVYQVPGLLFHSQPPDHTVGSDGMAPRGGVWAPVSPCRPGLQLKGLTLLPV